VARTSSATDPRRDFQRGGPRSADRELSLVGPFERMNPMTGKRMRYSAVFEAKVALKAIRGELTVAQIVAKHGVHQTLINAWKKQAVKGTVGVSFSKAAAAAVERAGRSTIFTPRSASSSWNAIFWFAPLVDDRRTEAGDDRAGPPSAADHAAMQVGMSQPVGSRWAAGPPFSANGATMGLYVTAVDLGRLGGPGFLGHRREDACPDATMAPPVPTIVDRGRRPIGRRDLLPATAALEHVDDAGDHPQIAHPAGTGLVGWLLSRNGAPCLVRQPEQRHRHLESLPSGGDSLTLFMPVLSTV
jgi:transposase